MISQPPLGPNTYLRQFFLRHYIPHCIEDPTSRNMEGYERALDLWEELTDNPPLKQITCETLSEFKGKLLAFRFRGRTLAVNTVHKHLSHIQWVLDQAGPPGRRGKEKTAVGILDRVPFTKLPKRRETYQDEVPADDIVKVFHVAGEHARLPKVPGVNPGHLWQAIFGLQLCTSLRIGQCSQIPMNAVKWDRMQIVLPYEICRKSKKDEPKPVHSFVMQLLMRIRGPRELLFPIFEEHSKKTIYDELHRLQDLAGVPHFGFHAVRASAITSLSEISGEAAQFAAGHASMRTTRIYQKVRLLSQAQEKLTIFDALAQGREESEAV
ncbi:site-specific integrase [Bremerella cremea]|uniref:Site-specific integrase n=1 Tax=Bremerella cremea TaxID=1031537 RepID=A0A368KNH0_9BACT|nr:site-specific integrase [Bremerella cremea]RCS41535.1 site-specific integrase [Bremerella cremea]